MLRRHALVARTGKALQPAKQKSRQCRGLDLRIQRWRGRVRLHHGTAQALAQTGFELVKKLVHALLQAFVFVHQCIAHHDSRHARIFFGEMDHHGHHPLGLVSPLFSAGLQWPRLCLGNLVDQGKHGLLNKVDQALKHLGLAGKVTV